MADAYEKPIGSHVFRFEPPDIIFTKIEGILSADDVRAICDEVSYVSRSQNLLFTVTDMSSMAGIAPDARGAVRNLPVVHGVAIVGVNFQLRLVLQFINKAYTMWKRGADAPMVFYATEAEAREWVAERRRIVSSRQ
jgi:hypothetical protein